MGIWESGFFLFRNLNSDSPNQWQFIYTILCQALGISKMSLLSGIMKNKTQRKEKLILHTVVRI